MRESIRNTVRDVKKFKTSYVMISPFLILAGAFVLAPIVIALYFGFTQYNLLQPPKWVGLGNYVKLFFYDELFPVAIKNTLILSIGITPVSYLICLLLAWLLNEFKPKSRAILTLLFYAPALGNVFFVWQLIFSGDANGLINAYLLKIGAVSGPIQWLTDPNYMIGTLFFILLWASFGMNFLVMIAGMQNVDSSLYEAGAVDGIKNRWQELWFITLPCLRPQLLFSAVMTIVGAFNIGPVIDVLCGKPSTQYKAWTIMNHLQDYGSVRFEFGYSCAIATVLFLLIVCAQAIVQRLIRKVGT